MQVYDISMVPKDAHPESDCWSEFWRELATRYGGVKYHVANQSAIGVAVLEAGMASGKSSVMLALDLGDCSAVVEMSLEAFETLAKAARGACEGKGWR